MHLVPAAPQASDTTLATTLLHVRDEKTSGTSGGGFTSGAWRTRTLNTTKTNEIAGAALSSNQVTLPAGTYFAEFTAPAALVNRHQARLQDVDSAATLVLGESTNASSSSNGVGRSCGGGQFTLDAEATVELQHRCQTTNGSGGFGLATSFGTEVYAELRVWKVDPDDLIDGGTFVSAGSGTVDGGSL